jgi:hypothetical protein
MRAEAVQFAANAFAVSALKRQQAEQRRNGNRYARYSDAGSQWPPPPFFE